MRENKPYAVVVGAVNMDIRGTPHRLLVTHDSNPGDVTMSLGGVGRNIAHNLALLGVDTALITALGEDMSARRVEESCRTLGIDLSRTLRVPGGATSTYLFITDHQGEMELAVSDMAIYDALTPDYILRHMDFLSAAALVVVDANIPAETISCIAENCAAPIFADPVSTAKAEKLRPVLGKLHTLKPNGLEAALLTGGEITDEVSLQLTAGRLLDTGLKRVFLSLGPQGVLCADHGTMARLPILPGPMENATGCGDAFMAALAWAYMEGLSLEEAGRAGRAAAAIALAGAETINPDMSADRLRRLAEL